MFQPHQSLFSKQSTCTSTYRSAEEFRRGHSGGNGSLVPISKTLCTIQKRLCEHESKPRCPFAQLSDPPSNEAWVLHPFLSLFTQKTYSSALSAPNYVTACHLWHTSGRCRCGLECFQTEGRTVTKSLTFLGSALNYKKRMHAYLL